MKGDFTRLTYDPIKHYAGVLMQQGRVQLDADWNEMVQILDHRLRSQATDTLGPSGTPEERPGFIVAASGDGRLTVKPGRIYVEGLVCELPSADGRPIDLDAQPFLPVPTDLDLDALAPGTSRTDLVYLEAWRRHVSFLEDPELREAALGGADTTTRLQTVWQVRVLKDLRSAGNVDCHTPIAEYDQLVRPGQGRMTVEDVGGDAPADPCLIGTDGGYSGLENRLYRVEIHDPGDLGVATYKWSRDNGAVGARIADFPPDARQVKVDSLGRDALTRFQPRQWVEVLGDRSEMADRRGTLARIEKVLAAERILVLDRAIDPAAHGAHPRVRRWDMVKDVPVASEASAPLEHGIEVAFQGSDFRAGDYWLATARSGQGTLGKFAAAPPHGEPHRFARLALVAWKRGADGALTADVETCVPRVPSLASLAARPDCCETIPRGWEIARRLQERLDAIATTGGSLCLPAGTHVIDRPLTIKAGRPIVLCGCGGNTRLVYKPEPGWSGPMVTVRGTPGSAAKGVTLRDLCLYAQDAPALVAVENATDVRIEASMLVNLPGATSAPAIVAGRNTDGLAIEGCRVLGGIAIEAVSGAIPPTQQPMRLAPVELALAGPLVKRMEVLRAPALALSRVTLVPLDRLSIGRILLPPAGLSRAGGDEGIARLALHGCHVRARFVALHVDKASGVTVESCDLGGLTAAGWDALAHAAGDLAFSVLPALDDALHQAFVGAQHPEALAPVAFSALVATDVLVSRSELRGGTAVAAVALEKAEFLENRMAGAAGLAVLYGSKVEVTQNEVATLRTAVLSGGLAADWDVRANRLVAGRGVVFDTARAVEALLRTAYAAIEKGLAAYQEGPEGVDVQAFDEADPPGPASPIVAAELQRRLDAVLEETGRLGDTGRVAALHVAGNAIAATDLGVAVEPGVRCSDLRIGENLVVCARLAGIRLHGQAQSETVLGWSYGAGQLVAGNRVRVTGVGISIETSGAAVQSNRLEILPRGARKALTTPLAGLLTPLRLPAILAPAAKEGRPSLLRTGLAEAAHRLQRQAIAADEVQGLTAQLRGPLAGLLKERGLGTEARLLGRTADLLAANSVAAAPHLRLAAQYLGSLVDSPAIRIAADGVAATSNTLVATGDASGGIAIDPPPRASAAGERPTLHSITVRENEILGGAGHGVDIGVAVKGLQVSGNMVRDMRGNGITTTADARGLEEADVAHNQVLGCRSGSEPGPPGRAAGILFENASVLRIIDNVVRATGADSQRPSVGIGVVLCSEAAVRGNTVRENGDAPAGPPGPEAADEGNAAGLLVWDCAGSVHVAENSLAENRSRAMLARMGAGARLTVTSNSFAGERTDRDHLVLVHGDADVVFAQNQVSYGSPRDDAGTSLYAKRASILGNVWNERDCAVALLLDADVYSLVGNVSARTAWAPVNGREQVAAYNVPQPGKGADNNTIVPPLLTPLRPSVGAVKVEVLNKALETVEVLPPKAVQTTLNVAGVQAALGGVLAAPVVEKATIGVVSSIAAPAVRLNVDLGSKPFLGGR